MKEFGLTFNLSCKPYVKEYLENCFGSPAYLRQDSVIGKHFFMLVEDVSDLQAADAKKVSAHEYPATITIKITEFVFLQKGYVLTPTNQRNFNKYVEEHFKAQFFLVLDTITETSNVKIREAIDYCYDRFDMSERFLPMDLIIKAYYRYRGRRNALIANKKNI